MIPEELGITHLEEPVYAMNYDQQKFIKDHVNMNVVAGEKLYEVLETSELLIRKCVDVMNHFSIPCLAAENIVSELNGDYIFGAKDCP